MSLSAALKALLLDRLWFASEEFIELTEAPFMAARWGDLMDQIYNLKLFCAFYNVKPGLMFKNMSVWQINKENCEGLRVDFSF